MSSVEMKQLEKATKKKISGTTYVVTSHFKSQGSTAVDKIRSFLNTNSKPIGNCKKL